MLQCDRSCPLDASEIPDGDGDGYSLEMPKPQKSARQKIASAVSKYGEKVFLLEGSHGKNRLFCRACSVHVAHDVSARIKRHVATVTHQRKAAEARKEDVEEGGSASETAQHSGSTRQVPLPVLLDEEAQVRSEQRYLIVNCN